MNPPYAIAYLRVRDEADILPWTIDHLVRHGLSPYVLDNWSTDGTWEMLRELPLFGYERFPGKPTRYWFPRAVLARVEQLSKSHGATWCTLYDADEFRYSPRFDETLVEGFQRVLKEGYNAINHKLYEFHPIDNNYQEDPEGYFRYYSDSEYNCKLWHVKAWSCPGQRPAIASSGGHIVKFSGIKVCPELFILKHYPLRTTQQSERKVAERFTRRHPDDHRLGWHVHYDHVKPGHNFIRNPLTLKEWKGEPRSGCPDIQQVS